MGSPKDAYLEGLARLAGRGFEFDGVLSNHGPMAVDALVACGETEAVVRWVNTYREYLGDEPAPSNTITDEDWRNALGDFSRVADWTEHFRRQLDEQGTSVVIDEWWPRLLPGAAGAGTHGVIRTAHAIRAWSLTQPEPLVLDELAHGFGYWAARYTPLSRFPTSLPTLQGTKDAHRAFLELPRLRDELRTDAQGITARLVMLRDRAEFEEATNEFGTTQSIEDAFSDLTREAARLFIEHGTRENVFPLVHALTAPAAIRMSLGAVPQEQWDLSLATGWQLLAAIGSAFTATPLPEVTQDVEETPTADALIGAAVEHGDEHVIKFTEACIREHAIADDDVLLRAASLVSRLI